VRIDVADPGSERLAVVAALVDAGFDVEAIELRGVVETRADLLVLAADAPDALAMLRRLRDDGRRPDVPVVLLGTPDGAAPIPEGPGFGAELVLTRPVDEVRLVEGVRRLLREHRPDRSMVERLAPEHTLELRERETQEENQDEERDDPSGVSAIRPMDAEEPAERPERKSAPAPRPSSVPQPTGVSQIERRSEVPLSVVTTGAGSSSVSSSTADFAQAAISDALRAVLTAADRRVFPGLAAIDVSIPAGEASARELVPDELFDDASPESEGEDEGLFVVAPLASVLGASVSSAPPRIKRPSSEPPAERDKKTSPGTPLSLGQGFKLPNPLPPRAEPVLAVPDDEALGPLDPSGARRLALVPGAMARALAAIVLSRASTRAIVTAPGFEAELAFARGELVRLTGPIATLALARLGRTAPDESSARARLTMLVERGDLSASGESLAMTRGERDVLARVLGLETGEAVFHASRDEDAPARLGPTSRVLGELATAAGAPPALAAVAAHDRLQATRALGGAAAAFGVAPEVARFFESADDGITGLELARAARLVPELPAIAALLTVAGALAIVPGRPESRDTDVRAMEQLVREHAARADDADYFTLLGLPDTAGEAEIARAHDGRRAMLAALPLEASGLGGLVPLRTMALAAIDEAAEVLGNPALRAAYAKALGGASPARPGAQTPPTV
jgi:hypothetical protein